jgi:hypothetical protein
VHAPISSTVDAKNKNPFAIGTSRWSER